MTSPEKGDTPTPITELSQFLDPKTRPDVRHSAIGYIVGLTGTDEGIGVFQEEDFKLGKSLCELFESTPADRSALLSALTNISSRDTNCANFIIEQSEVVKICAESCRKREAMATFSAKLLSNLSIHFAGKVYERVNNVWENFVADIVALLNESGSADFVDYMGYMLVNCTAMPKVRRSLCEDHLISVIPLVNQTDKPKRRLIAVDILRNLCFDDDNHPKLLDEQDELLCCLVKPLADEGDSLDEEEMDKLPLSLQYYDGKRCSDPIIVSKIVDSLYQLCATTHGRSKLRSKGVYAILRELDKATSPNGGKDSAGGMMLCDATPSSHLHALIGMLIRYESEMGIDPSLSSIRDLE